MFHKKKIFFISTSKILEVIAFRECMKAENVITNYGISVGKYKKPIIINKNKNKNEKIKST